VDQCFLLEKMAPIQGNGLDLGDLLFGKSFINPMPCLDLDFLLLAASDLLCAERPSQCSRTV